MIDKETISHYWSLGLTTLPTAEGKNPFNINTWKGGISDLSKYQGCYGIGIVCGKLSGMLECMDFDNHFGDAKEILSDFISQIKEIYDKHSFPIEATSGGGFHLLYKCPEINGNLKLAQRPKYNEKEKRFAPDTIIETRGEGGYFVVAPTQGYKFVRGAIELIPTITPEERKTMFEVARSFNTWSDIKKTEFENQNRPGDQFNTSDDAINEVKAALEENGWHNVGGTQWQRPGKKKGISATLGKVADNVFYVFSSNAYPFEPMKAYLPFQVISLLKYKGDFSECSKQLAARYQGAKPEKKQFTKPEVKPIGEPELESIMKKAFIDVTIPVVRPPVIMQIRDVVGYNIYERRLFTLGNFSAITGKSKSKKSFLAAMLLSAATKNGEIESKLIGNLPQNKPYVFLFDTEQSDYDAYRYSRNVLDIIGINEHPYFGTFALREYTPLQRCEIIDFVINKFKDQVGYIVIDGIADLATAINDEIEATRVVSLIMKWTKVHNTHITVNIHQNKNDNFATGHLGSSILKKAECIISVFKDEQDPMISKVECTDIRGTAEFNDFQIEITSDGIPKVKDMVRLDSSYTYQKTNF